MRKQSIIKFIIVGNDAGFYRFFNRKIKEWNVPPEQLQREIFEVYNLQISLTCHSGINNLSLGSNNRRYV